MKKAIILTLVLMGILATINAQVQTIDLEQTKGAFTQSSVELVEGDYQFNISNNGVGHEVGFVLVPKGKYDAANHIKEAYVPAPVATGSEATTAVVSLAPGEYEYFCPLNATPKYTLTVRGDVKKIALEQTPGTFTVQSLTVKEGAYQFEISNAGVDQEVGFVVVPKGKYDAMDHIKTAYVTSTVPKGSSSTTGIVELTAGEYEYFCPLNKTPKYTLTVVK